MDAAPSLTAIGYLLGSLRVEVDVTSEVHEPVPGHEDVAFSTQHTRVVGPVDVAGLAVSIGEKRDVAVDPGLHEPGRVQPGRARCCGCACPVGVDVADARYDKVAVRRHEHVAL